MKTSLWKFAFKSILSVHKAATTNASSKVGGVRMHVAGFL